MNAVKLLSLVIIITGVVCLACCVSSGYEDEAERSAVKYPSNPERGWYIAKNTADVSDDEMSVFKENNVTLVLYETNLDAYLDKALDAAILDEVENAFSYARRAGLSVIYRAAYDFDGKSNPEPKDINRIVGHINQLSPIFKKNEDVLFNVQAGFFGPWGEWHSSSFGTGETDPVKPEYQRMLVNALFKAVPESVTIAVRRPEYIRNIADESAPNAGRGNHQPVTAAEAFGVSKIARLAFHNDALMSTDTDMDTYIAPNYPRDTELAWINKQTRYTPFVGETNKVSNYNDPGNAVRFLDYMNCCSLNMEYHPNVLRKWQRARRDTMTVYDYVTVMMGYRFVLGRAALSETNLHGGNLGLELEITNTGFGHLLKEKKLELVLRRGGLEYRAAINEDARLWNKNELVKREFYFSLPSDLVPGEWEAYLGLSSAFPSLAGNPAYSVRFENDGIWDSELGLNKIGTINLTLAGSGGKDFSQIIP